MHHRSARGWTRGRREGEDARRNVEGERRDFESRRVGGAGDVERDESWRRFRRDARDRLPPDACAESSPFFANVRRAVDRAEFSRGREDVPETTRERVGGGEADAANDHLFAAARGGRRDDRMDAQGARVRERQGRAGDVHEVGREVEVDDTRRARGRDALRLARRGVSRGDWREGAHSARRRARVGVSATTTR